MKQILCVVIGVAVLLTSVCAQRKFTVEPQWNDAGSYAPPSNLYTIKTTGYKDAYKAMNNQLIKINLFDKNGYKINHEISNATREKSIFNYLKTLRSGQTYEVDSTCTLNKLLINVADADVKKLTDNKADYYIVAYYFKSKMPTHKRLTDNFETLTLASNKCNIKSIKVNMDER